MQTPPFAQGFEAHSLMSVSQCTPVKPGMHSHVYLKKKNHHFIQYFGNMCNRKYTIHNEHNIHGAQIKTF